MSELLKQKLKESLKKGSFPPFWTPKEKGEELTGQIMKVRTSIWNPSINIYEVKTFDDKVFSTPNNAVLNRLLSESNVKIGDYVMIKYEGTVVTGKGRKAKDFSVAVIPKEEAEKILSQEKPVEAPPKPPEAPKAPTPQPSIPKDVVDWAKGIFEFYDEMELERFQHYMAQRGYRYPAEAVAEAAGLKITGGKIVK